MGRELRTRNRDFIKKRPGTFIGGMATVAVKLQNDTIRDWNGGTCAVPLFFLVFIGPSIAYYGYRFDV